MEIKCLQQHMQLKKKQWTYKKVYDNIFYTCYTQFSFAFYKHFSRDPNIQSCLFFPQINHRLQFEHIMHWYELHLTVYYTKKCTPLFTKCIQISCKNNTIKAYMSYNCAICYNAEKNYTKVIVVLAWLTCQTFSSSYSSMHSSTWSGW